MQLSVSSLSKRRDAAGFTLLELMVVVAIAAILVAIAVPAYNDQARKARRATGKADLTELVQDLERFHTVNGTYNGFPTAAVLSPDGGTPAYSIVPSNLTATTYTLTATAQNGQVDDVCGDIVLTQTGDPTFSTGLTRAECWNR